MNFQGVDNFEHLTERRGQVILVFLALHIIIEERTQVIERFALFHKRDWIVVNEEFRLKTCRSRCKLFDAKSDALVYADDLFPIGTILQNSNYNNNDNNNKTNFYTSLTLQRFCCYQCVS